MANQHDPNLQFSRSLRRLGVSLLVLFLVSIFLFWRIDNPRAERMRLALLDRFVPSVEWIFAPMARASHMISDFQSYRRIYEQNQELRRELQKMRDWREAALQLEHENARLLELNNVKLPSKLTFTSGVVLTDSGSPFRQSALINLGAHDGMVDGWAAMDGLGLVGRISGVGRSTSRVLLLTDSSSRVPIEVTPSRRVAIMAGDNSPLPLLEFLDGVDQVQVGDRVLTSGDGGVFPAGLLVGTVILAADGRLRVKPSAEFRRLEFLRIIRFHPEPAIEETGSLVGAGLELRVTEPGNE